MDYENYLKTSHWQELKQRIYAKYRQCQNCGAKRGLDVHHKTYERLGHEKLSDLRLLCRECHYRTHRMKKGIRHWHPNDVIMRVWVWVKKNYEIESRR